MTRYQSFSKLQIDAISGPLRRFEVSILLTDGFSLLSLASLTDVFDTVETVWGSGCVRVRTFSVDGGIVTTSAGGRVMPDGTLNEEGCVLGGFSKSDVYIICSGSKMSERDSRAAMRLVRRCQRDSISACVMGAAVRETAMSGLIRKGTDHWSRIMANSETMPHIEFSNAIYVEDGNLVSCSGELGAMDFALNWVSTQISPQVSAQIRNHLLAPSTRSADRAQTCTVADKYKSAPPQLQEVLELMFMNLEEPLPMSSVAKRADLSVRQIERLFARYLSTSPLKFYRGERLDRARVLLEDTNMSVIEVGVACGFTSMSSFAKCFRNRFGVTPTVLRSAQQPLV